MFDVNQIDDQDQDDFDEIDWGQCCAPDDKGDKPAPKPAAKDDDSISDAAAKDYITSLENLHKNGATTAETVESFKRAIDALKKLDKDALEKELAAAAKNPKVHSILVAMHLKEALEKSGWTNISSKFEVKEGSAVLKNPKTETYISIQYSTKEGKAGAAVTIDHKGR